MIASKSASSSMQASTMPAMSSLFLVVSLGRQLAPVASVLSLYVCKQYTPQNHAVLSSWLACWECKSQGDVTDLTAVRQRA